MGKGMSKLRVDNVRGERTPRFCDPPHSSRAERCLACWMALQTAFAAPLASCRAANAASAAATNGGVNPASAPQRRSAHSAKPRPESAPCRRPARPCCSTEHDRPARARDAGARVRDRRDIRGCSEAASYARRTPTTADPGTLVPGGRRQTLTFADLGALDPLQLRGTDGQNGVPFSVRGDEVVTAAVLHLIYSYSPALLPIISQLKVLINGEVAATLPVPRDQAGTLVARDVSIDPRFITEFNHLNVQLIGHYTQQCEDPSSSSLWATVSNASSLDLTYASLASKPDLAALPQPFFDRRDVRRLELPFVFAQKPSAQTLEAAGAVASWFGSLAGYRGAVFPAQIDNAPLSGNAVVFATSDERPAGVKIPAMSGPTIAVVDREAPARGRLLLVLGRNDAELKTAAHALGIGQNTLSGQSATITQLNDLAAAPPYDAPNWLPTDRPVRFGELAEARDLTVSGYDADAVRVNLRVPPDLFMWQTKGVPIDLRLSLHGAAGARSFVAEHQREQRLRAVAADSGGVGVDVRSRPVLQPRDARQDRRRAPRRSTCRRCCSRRARSCACTSTTTSRRPANARAACSTTWSARSIRTRPSTCPASRTTWRCPTWPRSPTAASRSRAWPTCRETAVILPNDADSADYSLFLLEMGRMGASTGYPATGVTVASADQVDQFADKDLLILGSPGRQPLLQRWAKSMPFSGDGDSRTFQLTDVAFKVVDWWHGDRGVERSPARADLSLVSSSGDALITGFESPLKKDRSAVALVSAAGQSDADLTAALLDNDVLPEIQGAMAVIHGRTVTVTSNGEAYYVGHLSPMEYMRWALSSHPLLLVLGGLARRADHRRAVLPCAARDRRAPPEGLTCRLVSGVVRRLHSWRWP